MQRDTQEDQIQARCDQCGERFPNALELEEHYRQQHTESPAPKDEDDATS